MLWVLFWNIGMAYDIPNIKGSYWIIIPSHIFLMKNFQLYSFIRSLIFDIPCLFLFYSMQLLQHIESIIITDRIHGYFLVLLSSRDNLHMIHLNLDLFYDICNAIIKHNQKQIRYLSFMFPIQFNIYVNGSKSYHK